MLAIEGARLFHSPVREAVDERELSTEMDVSETLEGFWRVPTFYLVLFNYLTAFVQAERGEKG
jgi:hypothetical protein